ncbi:hypothetical protein [Lacrimispora sp.]|uniref:hypothetical protein n=1 Tax=Lacrimispora sp. TaxID=2719234 RepID=UPI0028AAF4B4|nr:hypothetical protein [Lacrimispora sp.]
MLHIILLILKILGLILLVILGLLLAVLLAVLFVPVRYHGSGSYYEKGRGSAGVSWLLHILSIRFRYDEDLTMTVRLFGFRIMKPKKLDRELEEAEDILVQAMERIEPEPLKDAKEAKEKVQSEIKKLPEIFEPIKDEEKIKKPFFLTSLWEKGKKRILRFFTKLKFFFRRVCDTLKTVKEKKDEIFSWISSKENQKTVKLFLKQGKKLIRHILPVKGKGSITFGFDDPYLTGQVLMYSSVIYPFVHKHLDLYPMFDQAIFQAEGTFRGRIRIGTALLIGSRMLMDKNFRMMLRKWLR